MAVLLLALLVGDVPDFGGVEFVVTTGAFGIVILIGWTMQSRRRRIEAFERERLAAERRAAADERLRIAQEMHDVVAHSLGLIAVQAGVGMHVIDSDPAEAKRSLESISHGEPVEPGRDPPASRRDPHGRRCAELHARSRAGRPSPPRGGCDGRGTTGRGADRGRHRWRAARSRTRRVPHRAGSADQLDPPREREPLGREARQRRGPAGHRGHR